MKWSIYNDGLEKPLIRNDIIDYFVQFYQFKPRGIYAKICRVNCRSWDKFLKCLRINRISINRILKIEYLWSKSWEIIYKKRHYGNTGFCYFRF